MLCMESVNKKVADTAIDWVKSKVPYEFKGASRRGCDCIGILVGILHELGYILDFNLPYYPKDWSLHKGNEEKIINGLLKYANEIPLKDMTPGDILIFHYGRYHSHIGIYVGNYEIIHCYEEANKCVYGVILHSAWEKRLRKAYRLDETKI